MAMLQVLPERMWPRTALGEAESVRLRAIEPATRNSHLIEDKPDIWLTMDNLDECAGPSFVAPLVPLERILLERFARMVTGSCADWTPGFRFRVAPVREARESVPQAEMAAEQRVGHFWAVASPTAARLAAMTAVAPLPQLNLGILRLLRGLLPEADLTHEAEVLLGGLLRLSTPQDGLPARATDYQLDFIEGVREQLLNSVRIDDAVETLRHLNRYIAERGIGIRTMHAELADPESHAGHIDGTNPELRQTVEVLQRIGGVHARLVGKPRKVATETPIPRSHAAVEIPVLSAEQASEEPAAGDPMPYEYDVFVSYARVDDQPVDSDSVGWVSALVKKFRNRVEQLTGRRGSVSIFMDVDNLPHDVDASREFTAIAGRSRLLLVVLSPGYIYSQGCQAELQAYLEASSRREDLIQPSAPFVVDLGEVAHEDWPLSLQGMLGYRFWSKDTITGHTRRLGYPIPMSDDREYYKVLDRLAREVSTELVAHRKRETVSSVLSAAESSAASGHVQTADSFQPPALPPLPSNVVYVSYASVDDEPSFAGDSGWVSTLVRLLSKRVAELAGWTDAVSFVMNKTVAGSSPADDGIAYAVKNSTMILVLLSPAYLLSAWARRELERLHGLEGRVFLLDLGNIDLDFLPSELRVRSVFSFWMEEQEGHRRQRRRLPGPDDPKYHGLYSDALNDLALEIFRAIQKDESPERSRSHDPEVHTRAAISVFLADVSDDLYFARDDVARYLSQAGFRVLPESEGLTNSMVEFDEGLHRALAESDFYIQLLSEHRGQRAPGRDETLPAYQYRIAKELGLPMRQWRDPDLRAEDVEDEHQRDLLFGQDVIACPLDEFSAFMVARLANPLGAIPPLSDPLVHVICAKEDSRWTEAVLNALNEAGWGWSYTRTDSSPEEPHGDLAEVIDVCDALLVVYDAGSAEWLRRQLVQIRKLAIHRARPLAAVGVLELRPGLHSPIGMKLPRMIHISLDHSPTLEDLRPFLQAVISRLDADAFSRPRRR
ncbi:MAG: hypothetical protein KJ000_07455 [Pirellulaceae bacterium]|nr:hypothetical protein [Pirellulaceae bacterium]